MIILWFVIKFRTKRDSERSGVKIDSQRVCSEKSGTLTPVCVSHTAGCGVLDSKPAPEIMYQYAQGAEKGLTATKKKKTSLYSRFILTNIKMGSIVMVKIEIRLESRYNRRTVR